MREILFRGKRTDNGEWVEGDRLTGVGPKHGKTFILPIRPIYPAGCNSLDGWEVDPSTVGQKTEFSDKNGIQIFEGDRFKSLRHKGTVLFIGSGFKLVKDSKKAGPKIWSSLSHHTCKSIEIIGNTHETKN